MLAEGLDGFYSIYEYPERHRCEEQELDGFSAPA